MELRPIGRVKAVRGNVSEIEVLPEYADGLYRVGDNEKVLIIYLFDRSERVDLQVHPKGDENNPLVGVFASRSPNRPNHIGITAVKLLRMEGNVLTVEGLDAWEGTPVLDIKPERRRDEVLL